MTRWRLSATADPAAAGAYSSMVFPVANGYGVLDFAVDATVADDYLRWTSLVTTTRTAGNGFLGTHGMKTQMEGTCGRIRKERTLDMFLSCLFSSNICHAYA